MSVTSRRLAPSRRHAATIPGPIAAAIAWSAELAWRWRARAGGGAGPVEVLDRLAGARTAAEARDLLADAARRLAGGRAVATFEPVADAAPGTLAVPLTFAGRVVATLRLVPARPRRWPRGLARRLEVLARLTAAVELALASPRPPAGPGRDHGASPSTAEIARDPATGLHTGPFLDAYLAQAVALARRRGEPLALLLIAPDPIAFVRRRDGRELADAALGLAARAVAATLRASDLVARLDGDRLAVVLPAASHADARQLASVVRRAVEEAGIASAVPVALTCTFAVACFPADAPDAPALRAAADAALARARASGSRLVPLAKSP